MIKKIFLCFTFFFAFSFSCSEKKVEEVNQLNSECVEIKNILTDCLGLHRGALGYVKNCGDVDLEVIKELNNCEEIFNHIENR